ncbi:MAG TPA: LysM peptidoglycan-binding domain-containing protein [Clostridiaceae bacterium]|nr:LysM peptidoglycan-binding domain-containing protein [Clostridiaceae bacterium]
MFKINTHLFAKIIIVLLLSYICFSTIAYTSSPVSAAGTVEQATVKYTVKSGDTLFFIAKKYNTTVSAIKNSSRITTDLIIPGQVLTVPVSLTPGSNLYSVKSGDTLFLIARKHGITVTELMLANDLKTDLIMPGQILIIPVRSIKPLKDILTEKGISPSVADLEIVVDKSDHTLMIFSHGILLKTYHVETGDGGIGDKQVAGDHKTPEGNFYITQKSVLNPADYYLGSRWLRLSYPNIEDAQRGLNQGIIDKNTYNEIVNAINQGKTPPQYTALGGGIGIHGGDIPEFGNNWTWGCVGLTNKDIEEFYDFVDVGTKVEIRR